MASTSASSWKLFCQALDHKNQCIGPCFSVGAPPNTIVDDLIKKIYNFLPIPARKPGLVMSPSDLELWKLSKLLPIASTWTECQNFEDVLAKLEFPNSESKDAFDGTGEVQILSLPQRLSTYWGSGPKEGHLHLTVRFPHADDEPGLKRSRKGSTNTNLSEGRPTNPPRYDVKRLGPNEVTRDNQIVFKLYDSLWGGKMDWTSITKSVEEIVPYCNGAEDVPDNEAEEVPDTIMKEPEQPSTACLADIKELIGWTGKDDERETLLCPCFLVRAEYRELDNYLSEDPSGNHVLVLGRPGIGKTIYLTHCLLRRLIAGLPTIFSTSPKRCYLFQESGVYWIPYDSFEFSENPDFVSRGMKDSLALFDFNEEAQLNTLSGFRHFRLLVTSLPNRQRYKSWVKHTRAKRYIMKTWTWPEVYHARSLATVETDEKTLRLGFMKYGGSARNLFEKTHEEVELLISTAIENCKDIMDLFPFDDEFRGEASHALIEINPEITSDGSLDREYINGHIATPYILGTLLGRKQMALANSLQETFSALFKGNVTQSASNLLARHHYIRSLFSQPLTIYPLSQDATNPISVDLSHVKDVNYFDPAMIEELGPINYHQPLSSSLPGIDAFVIECDDKKVPTGSIDDLPNTL